MKTRKFYAVSFICLLMLGTMTVASPLTPLPRERGTGFASEMAAATWKTQTKDLGKIPQNVPATIEFEVTNTGKAPLIISDVKAGCNCTVASFTKEPIMPGKTGKVNATYNASALGAFTKSVNVTMNTEPEITVLTFQGEVVTK